MSMAATVIMCIIFNIFAETIVGFFGLGEGSLQIGAGIVRYMSMFFWMFSAYMTVGGLLQGAGDTVLMSISTLTALGVRIATGYLAVYLGLLEHSAAWMTNPIGWIFALAITYTRYFTGGWREKAVVGRLSHKPK
jgi:Na+-driven multidrug efflux pump